LWYLTNRFSWDSTSSELSSRSGFNTCSPEAGSESVSAFDILIWHKDQKGAPIKTDNIRILKTIISYFFLAVAITKFILQRKKPFLSAVSKVSTKRVCSVSCTRPFDNISFKITSNHK